MRRESITGNFRSQYSLDVGEFEPGFSLPFVLTGEQKRTLGEILFDLSQPFPMNRLLQGEVGSGKTLVAFLAMRHLSEGIYRGSQCAFLAPTEILARQHAQNFSRYFPEVASRVGLLTGSLSKSAKNEVLEKIRLARFSYIFGTHALFQEKVMIPGLNFCIIDEQHRFGVSQRRSLIEKGKERFPHLLLMTATPIPRSLSLTIFGDMDVSTIKELPPGRKPIKTKLAKSREEALQEMKRHLANGGQTYFICPLIENSEKNQWVSVEEALSRLTKAFPEYKVAAITGKQSSDEKNLAIDLFHSGKIQILVATTVLEVGIDNPNATVMVIENAERFGLSQLHQLRGRIGRGTVSSICILVSPSGEDCERLSVFSEINDGFLLSAEDLRFRGAGDILGTKQSGFSRQIFSQLGRLDIIEKARERALSILTNELPETREWFLDRMRESFGGDFDDFLKGG
ncbi:ATP-dependent DNA helicase RecG [bacterium]|nr:ATP-dependent DNA helicase RecG [bacterium]